MDSNTRKDVGKQIAFVLQGGGALGSYQAGVYEALERCGYLPDWVAGISIGGINSAIIAGNEPGMRVAKLREFWELITEPSASWPDYPLDGWKQFSRHAGAMSALLFGQPGFFRPNPLQAWMTGTPATSYYDTMDLKSTMERLVDFDRINSGHTRLSVGAVNVRTGNFAYFDSAHIKLGPEHIMASGALPPGFPAVEVDGEIYWDGGLVSNTPLQYVLECSPRRSTLAFQVDLFPARGPAPLNLEQVEERRKDIQYSSRSRLGVDSFREMHNLRRAISQLLHRLPEEHLHGMDVDILRRAACQTRMDVVEVIYRPTIPQGPTKDYEFSRATMALRWKQGMQDATASLAAEPWLEDAPEEIGARAFDVLHGHQM